MFESLSTHIYFFTKLFISSIIERFALVRLSSQRELLVLEDYVLNVAKDTTDPKVEWSHRINLFLLHNILVKIQLNFRIFSTCQHQHIDKTPVSKPRLNFNLQILTKHCAQSLTKTLKNSTKPQGQYLDQTLGSKPLPNFSFKILTKHQHQDINQT